MCTVTYIPPQKNSGFILTSNRDEKTYRETIPPHKEVVNNIELYFPKDKQAGGSWIALNKEGKAVVLLNGAFFAHKKLETHIVSRGKILIEFASSYMSLEKYFQCTSLKNVEPFTLICIEQNDGIVTSLDEVIWDGYRKHFTKLDAKAAYIWSSATLYNREQRAIRRSWFETFLKSAEITKETVLQFHLGKHTDDKTNNLLVERPDKTKTVSTTQISQQNEEVLFDYYDLLNEKAHSIKI